MRELLIPSCIYTNGVSDDTDLTTPSIATPHSQPWHHTATLRAGGGATCTCAAVAPLAVMRNIYSEYII